MLTNNFDEILLDGGSRSGKTFLIVFFIILLCSIYPIRVLIARLRFNHAKNSLWAQTLIPFLETNFKGHYEINKTDFIIKLFGKSEIWLGGLDDKDRADKILGQEYSIIYLNEATDISPKTIEKCKTRLAQNTGLHNFLVMDCNPKSPQHYLYKRFILKEGITVEKIYRQLFLPKENIDNLPENYITTKLESLTGSDYQRYALGQWCNIEGAVYKNILEKNVIDTNKDLLYYDDVSIGIDFGYISAIVFVGYKENKAYVFKEATIIGGTTQDIIRALNEVPYAKKYIVYTDHEPDRKQEIESAGYMVKFARKEVGAGDSIVNETELYFDKKCIDTYNSCLNLSYIQDNDGNFLEKHIKENDHWADALRYAVASYKLDNVSPSDVFSPISIM